MDEEAKYEEKRRPQYLTGGIRYKRRDYSPMDTASEAAEEETIRAALDLARLRKALRAADVDEEDVRDLTRRSLEYLYGGVRYRRRGMY